MIKANITREYPAHIATCIYSDKSLYLTDYTEQTKTLPIKRSVEIFQDIPPIDIDYFTLKNDSSLWNGFITFDNTSLKEQTELRYRNVNVLFFPKQVLQIRGYFLLN